MIKADLHNHLGRNGANPGFDETIDLVYNKLGENFAFGICNCNCDIDDNRFENFVSQKGGKYNREWLDDEKRFLLVPEKQIYVVGAEEIITKQGHLVVAGMPYGKNIQTNPDEMLSLEDALKSADDFNGIKIAAHPFSRDGLGDYLNYNLDLCNKLDGWEIYNASAELSIPKILPFFANENSIKFYNEFLINDYNIGACAFTDGHSVGVVGKSYTDLYLEDFSVDSLRDAIKYNTFENLHMESAKWDAFKHAVNMVKHKLFNVGA